MCYNIVLVNYFIFIFPFLYKYSKYLCGCFRLFQFVTESDAVVSVGQIQQISTLDPVGLRRANSTRPGSLQGFVGLSDFVRNLPALFEMKPLHVSYCLVNPADRRRIADSTLCSVSGSQVSAVDASNAHLSLHQLLSTLRVASRNIL
jgi:hypothetical protein